MDVARSDHPPAEHPAGDHPPAEGLVAEHPRDDPEAEHPVGDPAGEASAGRGPRRRRRLVAAGIALVVVVGFLAVTAVTGLPAPGPLHRYPYADLAALRDRVNEEAGDIRTPDDCWRTLYDNDGPTRSIADVDLIRSRVVVRMYSGNVGRVDPWTYNGIVSRLDALVASDPELTWGMIQLEASPDGWSPQVSCRLVTRGYGPR